MSQNLHPNMEGFRRAGHIFDVTDVSLSLMSWGIIVIVVKGVSLSLMSWASLSLMS